MGKAPRRGAVVLLLRSSVAGAYARLLPVVICAGELPTSLYPCEFAASGRAASEQCLLGYASRLVALGPRFMGECAVVRLLGGALCVTLFETPC